MTRPISPELQAHLALDTTTLALLWRITRTDDEVFAYTDHDQDIEYLGDTYKASNSFSPTSVRAKDDLSIDNLDVTGILGTVNTDITHTEISEGKYDFALVEIMLINYADPTQDVMVLLKGWLGRIILKGSQFTAEIRSQSAKLQTNIGRLYTPACDAILGDTRCGKDLTAFTFTGEVTDVTNNSLFKSSDLTQSIAFFTGGQINWTSGLNDGLSMEIKEFIDEEVVLSLPMPNTVTLGDTFSIVAGCDKVKETCKTKFNNLVNFRGFPDVPGTDKILETAGTFTSDES